jgi:hypothetical protein
MSLSSHSQWLLLNHNRRQPQQARSGNLDNQYLSISTSFRKSSDKSRNPVNLSNNTLKSNPWPGL